jgi:hypothetical protein
MLLTIPLDVLGIIIKKCRPLTRVMLKLSCKRLNHVIKVPKPICYLMTSAACYKYLEIVKYLHSRGYGWNSFTAYCAIRYGNFDVFQYLFENRIGINDFVIIPQVITTGKLKRTPLYLRYTEVAIDAARYNKLEILQFMHKNDILRNSRDCWIVAPVNDEMIEWLRSIM